MGRCGTRFLTVRRDRVRFGSRSVLFRRDGVGRCRCADVQQDSIWGIAMLENTISGPEQPAPAEGEGS